LDQDLGREVALKRLDNLASLSSEENRQQILKEAQAVSKLGHSYIVTVFDVTSIGDYIWMVMEYIKGKTLAAWLTEEQQLPLKQVIAIVEQAAQALDHAHSNHVIHRDIKPANLIIKDDGQLKLTDFGIAKIIGDAHAAQSTGLKGTVLYMSPEQVNDMPLDGRSDLFSLATITYEMLTGTSPWAGKGSYELMTNISKDQPRSLKEYEVPAADQLDPILLKALAKDPAARYQSGEDFVRALKTVS
jgi:serine/threonine-protein kinase